MSFHLVPLQHADFRNMILLDLATTNTTTTSFCRDPPKEHVKYSVSVKVNKQLMSVHVSMHQLSIAPDTYNIKLDISVTSQAFISHNYVVSCLEVIGEQKFPLMNFQSTHSFQLVAKYMNLEEHVRYVLLFQYGLFATDEDEEIFQDSLCNHFLRDVIPSKYSL